MTVSDAGPRRSLEAKPADARAAIALAVILAVFVAHAISLNFTQDDAYISFRYVKNLLAGHGLVFNPGERVEGYTSFLWIMILSLFAGFGLDLVLVSKVLGVVAGCISIVVLYKTSRLCLTRAAVAPNKTEGPIRTGLAGITAGEVRLLALVPPLLLASNGSFAYWSVSGLETPLFALGVLTTLHLYLSDPRLAAVSAAVTSLVRPEGVLVFLALMVHSLLARRESVRRTVSYILLFGLLLVPFLLFRMLYYGDLLPNPFYAKTGISAGYLSTGLAYFVKFLKQYGVLGLLYLLPAILWRRLGSEGRLLLVMAGVYSLYVILVGGDVLRGDRFFVPVLGPLYVLFVFAVVVLTRRRGRPEVLAAARMTAVAALAAATFLIPRDSLLEARRYELGLTDKLTAYAENLKKQMGSDFTVAIATIGVISYQTDARVIDMLGLTDPYIAKHPEKIPGLTSTWKERRFNITYLLSKDPDVIIFSTGHRPSALAEKALFLHSKFRQNYYLYILKDFKGNTPAHLHLYRRKGEFAGRDMVYPDAAFVDLYSRAIHLYSIDQDFDGAIDTLRRMFRVMPDDFARGYEFMGTCQYFKGDTDSARTYALKAVAKDDYLVEAHALLRDLYLRDGNKEAARQHTTAILRYNPEVLQQTP